MCLCLCVCKSRVVQWLMPSGKNIFEHSVGSVPYNLSKSSFLCNFQACFFEENIWPSRPSYFTVTIIIPLIISHVYLISDVLLCHSLLVGGWCFGNADMAGHYVTCKAGLACHCISVMWRVGSEWKTSMKALEIGVWSPQQFSYGLGKLSSCMWLPV